MEPFKPKRYGNAGPEAKIRDGIKARLEQLEWFVKITHGNQFQSGLPDLWCCHALHGQRWIEVKQPTGYSFTPAQQHDFPIMHAKRVGIWILNGYTDQDIMKLFKPANWLEYYMAWSMKGERVK